MDLVAPGVSVTSLRNPGSTIDDAHPGAVVSTRFFRGSGTSQAAAVVSGAAALPSDRERLHRIGGDNDRLRADIVGIDVFAIVGCQQRIGAALRGPVRRRHHDVIAVGRQRPGDAGVAVGVPVAIWLTLRETGEQADAATKVAKENEDNRRREVLTAIRKELLARRTNGVWDDSNYNGTAFGTAMACIILQLPNNYLPIMQK